MSAPPSSLTPAGSSGDIQRLRNRARVWLVLTILSLVGILVPPIVGVSGTVFSMVSAFDRVGRTGQGSPGEMADSVSSSMMTTMIGIIVAFLFGILFFLSLILWMITWSKIRNSAGSTWT